MNKTQRQKAWECGLPAYLQHDLDAYKEGLRTGSTLLSVFVMRFALFDLHNCENCCIFAPDLEE